MFGEHMQDLLQQRTEPEPEGPSRELTVDEALEIAIQLQQDGRLEEANVVYGQILLYDPANPRALHFSGVLAHQLGRSSEAVELIQISKVTGVLKHDTLCDGNQSRHHLRSR